MKRSHLPVKHIHQFNEQNQHHHGLPQTAVGEVWRAEVELVLHVNQG